MEKFEVEANEITPKTRQPTPDLEIVVNPANPTASNKLELAETFVAKTAIGGNPFKGIYSMTNWYLKGI